jgi:hypothetical protein
VSAATVSRVLKRLGLNKLKALDPVEPVRRYEREHPGELIHIDIKKLGRFVRPGHRITHDRQKGESRGAGHEFVHVAIDDASRLAFSQIRRDQRKESAIALLRDAARRTTRKCAQGAKPMEEADLRLKVLEPVARCWSMPTISTETMDCFSAPYSFDDRVAPGNSIAPKIKRLKCTKLPLRD